MENLQGINVLKRVIEYLSGNRPFDREQDQQDALEIANTAIESSFEATAGMNKNIARFHAAAIRRLANERGMTLQDAEKIYAATAGTPLERYTAALKATDVKRSDDWPTCRGCGSNLGDGDTLDQPDEETGVCQACKAKGVQ